MVVTMDCKFMVEYVLTYWEVKMALVGSTPELGCWDPKKAPKAYMDENCIHNIDVKLPATGTGRPVEFKWVTLNEEDTVVRWEECFNKKMIVPSYGCGMTVVIPWNQLPADLEIYNRWSTRSGAALEAYQEAFRYVVDTASVVDHETLLARVRSRIRELSYYMGNVFQDFISYSDDRAELPLPFAIENVTPTVDMLPDLGTNLETFNAYQDMMPPDLHLTSNLPPYTDVQNYGFMDGDKTTLSKAKKSIWDVEHSSYLTPPIVTGCLPPPTSDCLPPPETSCLTPTEGSYLTSPEGSCLTPPESDCLPPPDGSCLTLSDSDCLTQPNGSYIPPPGSSCLPSPDGSYLTLSESGCLIPSTGSYLRHGPSESSCIPPPESSCLPSPEGSYLTPPNSGRLPSEGSYLTHGPPESSYIPPPEDRCFPSPEGSYSTPPSSMLSFPTPKAMPELSQPKSRHIIDPVEGVEAINDAWSAHKDMWYNKYEASVSWFCYLMLTVKTRRQSSILNDETRTNAGKKIKNKTTKEKLYTAAYITLIIVLVNMIVLVVTYSVVAYNDDASECTVIHTMRGCSDGAKVAMCHCPFHETTKSDASNIFSRTFRQWGMLATAPDEPRELEVYLYGLLRMVAERAKCLKCLFGRYYR